MDMAATKRGVTKGVHHVGLSVSNLADATSFFVDALGFELIWSRPEYPAAMVSDGAAGLSLWQVDQQEGRPFDRRRNEGLHHLALAVADREKLESLHAELTARNIRIEFAPQLRSDGKALHMMCFMPGGPRIELISPLAG
jgi:catechol 2,3-dioxygenase-like lactoylglutathione lyase family enzyme